MDIQDCYLLYSWSIISLHLHSLHKADQNTDACKHRDPSMLQLHLTTSKYLVGKRLRVPQTTGEYPEGIHCLLKI